ncbi:Mpo1-like protein [Dongia sp. agr-C8]
MPTDKRGFQISYSDFWRLYLDAHRSPATRGMHYAATLVGAASTLAAAILGELLLAPLGIMIAVGMAVGSHRFIEHNRPLIRINPLYGAICDLRMMWLAITGGLPREYARLGLGAAAPRESASVLKA